MSSFTYRFNFAPLYEYADEIMAIYKRKLAEEKVNASGALSKSADMYNWQTKDDNLVLLCDLMEYWEEIEYGRRPTKNKGDGVVFRKIRQWIDDKRIQTPAKFGFPHRIERHVKDKQGRDRYGEMTDPRKSFAYAITVNIHKLGFYKPNHHGKHLLEATMKEAKPIIEKVKKEVQRQLGSSVRIDIDELKFIEVTDR